MLSIVIETAETFSPIDSYVNGDTQNSRSAGEQVFLFDSGICPLNKHII